MKVIGVPEEGRRLIKPSFLGGSGWLTSHAEVDAADDTLESK